MMLGMAIRRAQGGGEELDMDVIKQLADAYDAGSISDEGLIATFIIAAYDTGFAEGMRESERMQAQTIMLMSCTAGNA